MMAGPPATPALAGRAAYVAVFFSPQTMQITRIVKLDSDNGLKFHPPSSSEHRKLIARSFYDTMSIDQVADYLGLARG